LEDYPGTLLLRVGLAIQQEISASYAREQGLAVAEWRMLARLNADGPMRLPDLCRALALDKPYASRLLRGLVERALVAVKKDPEHGLRLIVGITAAGRAIARKLLPRMHETQSALIDVLDGHERTVLYSALRKLQAAIPECRPRPDRGATPLSKRKTR
jgi:DNA-binding MarR family transcriptional regulator